MATKDETHAWLNSGGDRLGLTYGLTSTMKENLHWFTEGNKDDFGFDAGYCCEDTDQFFVCAKPVVPGE